jgi:hypothetical protein
MNIRSYIPFVTIPLACFIFFRAGADVMAGKVDLDVNTLFMVLWLALAFFWTSSGVVKLCHPYIVADDRGITVYGHPFSNRASQEIPWNDIVALRGQTCTSVILDLRNATVLKIPINGIGRSQLTEFLALIELRIRDANKLRTLTDRDNEP